MAKMSVDDALKLLGPLCDELASIKDIEQYKFENEKHFKNILLSIIGWYKYICRNGSLEQVVSAVELIDDIRESNPASEKIVNKLLSVGSPDTKKAFSPRYGTLRFLQYLDERMSGVLNKGYYDLDELYDVDGG